MFFGLDSAFPSNNPGGLVAIGYNFVCGYLEADDNQRTPHIWTYDEWASQADAGLFLAPIFVAPFGVPTYEQGINAGNKALNQMQRMNLSGIFILDIENGDIATDYTKGVVDSAHNGKCQVGVYGSYPTILSMSQQAGAWFWDKTWLANWVQSGVSLHKAMPDWDMWQYATGPQFDYNVAVNDFPFAQWNG